MSRVAFPLAVIALSGVIALAVWPALARRDLVRRGICWLAAVTIALAPLLIDPQARLARFVAALAAITSLVKLVDLASGPRLVSPPSFHAYACWLTNIYALVCRWREREPRYPARRDLARAVIGAMLASAGAVLMYCAWHVNWPSFAIEHVAKVSLLAATLWPAGVAGSALTRLSGQPARELMLAPLVAATPTDFWRCYNRPVNQWLHAHVFLPLGGRHAPVRGVLAAFFVSGLIHEYVFFVSVGRSCGHQLAFFMLQGLAVAATARLNLKGSWAAVGMLLNWLFMLTTSTLFFASLQGVLPVYSQPLPWWMRCG